MHIFPKYVDKDTGWLSPQIHSLTLHSSRALLQALYTLRLTQICLRSFRFASEVSNFIAFHFYSLSDVPMFSYSCPMFSDSRSDLSKSSSLSEVTKSSSKQKWSQSDFQDFGSTGKSPSFPLQSWSWNHHYAVESGESTNCTCDSRVSMQSSIHHKDVDLYYI